MSLIAAERGEGGERNDPLALRMAVIAFLNQNITIACVWGSFSVLLGAVEAHLGVGREMSSLAVPAVSLATAACAPVVGVLAARYPLRPIMLAGSLLSLAGFAVLAATASFAVYLLAFGLLLGPGMAVGAILPATLVTRWYTVNRGKALGLVCAPVVVTIVPLASNWALQSYGLSTTYAMLACLSAVTVVANLFVADRPPGIATDPPIAPVGGEAPVGNSGMTLLLRSPRFWAMTLAFISSITGSVIITSHMVPMARSWGLSATRAASLLTIQSGAGIAGTLAFGWIADRLGGALSLAALAFGAAVLWLLLLLQPPFAATAAIVALIGICGSGAVPVISIALSETFGRDGFSRAYGLINLVNLPFVVSCVPAAAVIYARTGSYAGAIAGEAAFLTFGGVLALACRQRRLTKPRHALQ